MTLGLPISSGAFALIAAYFGAVLGLSLLKRVHIRSRTLHLLRAFFPSWRFFEDYGWAPLLLYRVRSQGGFMGEWMPVIEKLKPSPLSLFLNARGNHALACGNLLQHLISDLEDADDQNPASIEASVSYELTRRLVSQKVVASHPRGAISHYQFKLSTHLPDQPQAEIDDLMISRVYEANDVVF